MNWLPEQRWLRLVVAAMIVIFVGVAIYVFGVAFDAWVESDAAVTDVLAGKVLDAKSPIVSTWYYANGDVWVIGQHLIALIPVALLGVGLPSLLLTLVIGFVLEVYVLAKVYTRLSNRAWIGVLAAIVTMAAWSKAHVEFGYAQIAYSFLTMMYLVTFTWTHTLVGTKPSWRWLACTLFIAAVVAQNPMRGMVFLVAPLLAGSAWPWRGTPLRQRFPVVVVSLIGAVIAYATYAGVFTHVVTFSMPRGHLEFAFANLSGIAANLAMLGRGLVVLSGGGSEPNVLSIPGALLMAGAITLVVREAMSRDMTRRRFVAIVVLSQLAIVMIPLIAGNLLVDIPSVRYLMPSLLAVLGLAVVLAVSSLGEMGRWPMIARAWLVLAPVTAAIAVFDVGPPEPAEYVWPDSIELDNVAHEISNRGLTRGYSNVLNATLLTMQTHRDALVCPIYMSAPLIPQRWLTDTACFDAKTLPDRYFIVGYRNDKDRDAVAKTLGRPSEIIAVGTTYEIQVFRTAETPLAWLDLPLPENDRSAFPLHIAANHLQLKRGEVTSDGTHMVGTGKTGMILYGPYIKMPRGRYILHWMGHGLASPGEVKFFVVAAGKDVLTERSVVAGSVPTTTGELVQISFKLDAPRESMEFSVYSQDGGRIVLDELVIERK